MPPPAEEWILTLLRLDKFLLHDIVHDMETLRKNSIAIYAGLAVALCMGFFPLSSLSAQSQGPCYARSATNGFLYLVSCNPSSWPTFGGGGTAGASGSGLSISCAPLPANGATGQTITWFGIVYGGSGNYLYSWNGTDGLSGNTNAVSKTYATAGEKFGILTVTSGNRQTTVLCGGALIGLGSGSGRLPYGQYGYGQIGGLGASCYATEERAVLGESVTWLSIVSGATASTTYSWDGAEGLTGERPIVSKTYTENGNKFAMLTVSDGKNRMVASCTNFITVGAKIPTTTAKPVTPPPVPSPTGKEKTASVPIQALCIPSSAKTEQGNSVVWHAVAIGGIGEYRFSWFGDETLSGEGATTSKAYEKAGGKRASVTVVSGDKAKTVACYPLEITKSQTGFSAGTIFSRISGPIGWGIAAVFLILFGVFMALRKRSTEDSEEEERDHTS